jgi:BASS family bile acid:Na+ symporter
MSRLFHAYLIWWLIGSYALAAVVPNFGLWIRETSLGRLTLFHQTLTLSMPTMMLAFLLFNSGLGVKASQLRNLLQNKAVLIAGLTANLIIPIAFIFGVSKLMQGWHNFGETGSIVVGLALIASMPIAGSSTAWSQIANGDLALSLGLVIFSTLFSPLTMPIILLLVGEMATGQYAEALQEAASYGAGAFLWIGVVLPSCLGLLIRWMLGEARIASVLPYVKLFTIAILLLLNYSNAAVSLPHTAAHPDLDFIFVISGITAGLCLLAFASAYGLARFLNIAQAQEVSLMYGMGMNNNGMGLVLASLTLAAYPRVMLPLIVSNLIQHVVAGSLYSLRYRRFKAEE